MRRRWLESSGERGADHDDLDDGGRRTGRGRGGARGFPELHEQSRRDLGHATSRRQRRPRRPRTRPHPARPDRRGGGGFGGGNFANRFNTPPAGVDPTKYKATLAACRSKLPTGIGNPLNNTAFQAYRSCLKDHGVTLPANGGAGSINRNDPKVQAAMKICQPLLPTGGFGRSTTTTTAPGA